MSDHAALSHGVIELENSGGVRHTSFQILQCVRRRAVVGLIEFIEVGVLERIALDDVVSGDVDQRNPGRFVLFGGEKPFLLKSRNRDNAKEYRRLIVFQRDGIHGYRYVHQKEKQKDKQQC